MVIPDRLNPLHTYLVERIGTGDFCLFSNVLIGKHLQLQPRTVGRQLTELERLGVIIRTQGPPAHGGFEPGANDHGNKRRIYFSSHPHVQHLRPLEVAPAPPPHPYQTRYADIGNTGHLRRVRHDKGLTLLARAVYGEVVEIAGSGSTAAPPAYYVWALGCTNEEAVKALEELHASGDIYLLHVGTTWFYGTTAGLFESLTMAAAGGNKSEVARLKQVAKELTIFGGHKGLGVALKAEEHAAA